MNNIFTGFCTNGEWNSLRSKGNTRPLSIFEIRSRARNYCSRLSLKKMLGMLTPERKLIPALLLCVWLCLL